jgi:hypothetical protein
MVLYVLSSAVLLIALAIVQLKWQNADWAGKLDRRILATSTAAVENLIDELFRTDVLHIHSKRAGSCQRK